MNKGHSGESKHVISIWESLKKKPIQKDEEK